MSFFVRFCSEDDVRRHPGRRQSLARCVEELLQTSSSNSPMMFSSSLDQFREHFSRGESDTRGRLAGPVERRVEDRWVETGGFLEQVPGERPSQYFS